MEVLNHPLGDLYLVNTCCALGRKCVTKGSCIEGLVPSWWIRSLRGDWLPGALAQSMDS
jgi:hypothetical protein